MWRRLLSTAAASKPQQAAKRNSQLWGFHSQQEVTNLLCEQKIIINFMDKLQRNTSQDTAKEFALDLPKLDTGLKLSYKRIAQVFEENVPGAFELKNSDLVSPELARQLDYQLELFQKQGKVPRLNLHDEINVNVVGLWLFPKYTREVLQSVSDGQYWEYYKMLPFYFRAQFYNLFLYLPGQRELVLAVEFTVKERFELVDKDVAGAPKKYADDFIGVAAPASAPEKVENKPEVAENVEKKPEVVEKMENKPEVVEKVENTPETEQKQEQAEPHKHYFVYVAQVDENLDSEEQDIDFVLQTMNEPFDFLLGM